MISIRKRLWISTLVLAFTLSASNALLAGKKDKDDDDDNIVAAIISAPVVTNGIVADEPTEFNIILNASGVGQEFALDPNVFGFQIPAGGRMEVELGEAFTRNTRINPDTGLEELVPINPNANIILTTGPQNPIIFQSGDTVARGNWSVSDDGANTITVTPNGGNGNNGLENARAKEIGVKVIHVRPGPSPRSKDNAPYINGGPGEVGTISVRIYDKRGKLRGAGFGDVVFKPRVGRQIHNTNEGLRTRPGGSPDAETIENVDFQRVKPNTALTNTEKTEPFSVGFPYAPRFLMFEELDPNVRGNFTDASFIPQVGIDNVTYEVNSKKPWTAKLVQMIGTETETIGAIVIRGPTKSSRGMILPSPGLITVGGNGSFLSVSVQVGRKKGVYTVTVTLLEGGQATNHIIVTD